MIEIHCLHSHLESSKIVPYISVWFGILCLHHPHTRASFLGLDWRYLFVGQRRRTVHAHLSKCYPFFWNIYNSSIVAQNALRCIESYGCLKSINNWCTSLLYCQCSLGNCLTRNIWSHVNLSGLKPHWYSPFESGLLAFFSDLVDAINSSTIGGLICGSADWCSVLIIISSVIIVDTLFRLFACSFSVFTFCCARFFHMFGLNIFLTLVLSDKYC